jgi:hypothetical protein
LADVHAASSTASQPEPAIPRWQSALLALALSIAILIPCYWQSRIQAGDLASHAYNAWLATLIREGHAPGLTLVSQYNNLLFDWLLEWRAGRVGFAAAQRQVISFCVLVFFWGAYVFIARVSERRAWFLLPCVAILAYGAIFHAGFFNFYLALGFCLWYLAFAWYGDLHIRLSLAPLLALAWLAHPFPVLWTVAALVFVVVRSVLPQNLRALPFIAGLASVPILRAALMTRYRCWWSARQLASMSGATQAILYDRKYLGIVVSLLVVWIVLLWLLLRQQGWRLLFRTTSFQLWIITALGAGFLPDMVLLPQYAAPLGFISVRLALIAAILLCTTLARVEKHTFASLAFGLLAAVFFAFAFHDDNKLNHREDEIAAALQHIPPGQRVVSSLPFPFRAIDHLTDRACIGRCFSITNYEPSSGQFRVQALSGSRLAINNSADFHALETGKYVVREDDLPLYNLYPCGEDLQEVCVRTAQPGDIVGLPRK